MASNKSLDEVEIIAALLNDIQMSHGVVFSQRALRLTTQVVRQRVRSEGLSFLTKTLPRLGKAFDKAISSNIPLNSIDHGFKPLRDSNLPRFLGEFFSRILLPNGTLLPNPNAKYVAVIRSVCFVYYKYKLPYSHDQEEQVISQFVKTEREMSTITEQLQNMDALRSEPTSRRRFAIPGKPSQKEVVREAKCLLSDVFAFFDPTDIYPRHGPGTVATKQRLWDKYLWSNVSSRITDVYPLDAYFYASLGHFCDDLDSVRRISDKSHPAKVILVPKDSRGPRLISCEPVDFQWIQQGLGRAIVERVESHPLTRGVVNFTDQTHNRDVALLASRDGRYSTLDLNEASDRVSLALVKLLYPDHVYTYLAACRTSCTLLPNGEILDLAKFAPMGSCLCFPILATVVWAILAAAAPDVNTRERILVYGDDVIVPTAYAENAIEQLESFGLKINRDKSCTGGLFRESCGMDAFSGVDVTPVRFRTVWSSHPDPGVYSSYIAYANACWDRGYFTVYERIVEALHAVYGAIPDKDMQLACPSLSSVESSNRPKRKRNNKHLQKCEYYVWDIKPVKVRKEIRGWSRLLRYFAEVGNDRNRSTSTSITGEEPVELFNEFELDSFDSGSYTKRRTSMLVRRWR